MYQYPQSLEAVNDAAEDDMFVSTVVDWPMKCVLLALLRAASARELNRARSTSFIV